MSEPRAFEAPLLTLPDDVDEAYQQFRLVIMRHRAEKWSAISEDCMVGVLWELMRECWKGGDA